MRLTVLGLNQWALAILIAALVASGCYVKGRLDGKAIETHAMQIKLDAANARADKTEKASRDRIAKVDRDYAQTQLATELKYRGTDLPPVRLCLNAASVEVPGDPDATSGDHAATEANGLSRDIAPDLKQLVRDADDQAQQLLACQAYIRQTLKTLR